MQKNVSSVKRSHPTANRRKSSYGFLPKLLLIPPLAGALSLVLLLLLCAKLLSGSSDPEGFSNLCVLLSVFVSGGVCGKVASKIAGKPFPWCIFSCLILAAIGTVVSFSAGFCPDTDRIFKGAVLFCSLLGSVCFSVPGSKKERRPKH